MTQPAPIPLVPSGNQPAAVPAPAKTSRGLGALPHVAGHGITWVVIALLASGGALLWPLLIGGAVVSGLLLGSRALRKRPPHRAASSAGTSARTGRRKGLLPSLRRPGLPGLGGGTPGIRKGSLPGTQRGTGWPAPGAKPIRRAGLRGLLPGKLGRAPGAGAGPGGRPASGGLLSRLRGKVPGLGGKSSGSGGRMPGTGANGPKTLGSKSPGSGRLARLRSRIPGLGGGKPSGSSGSGSAGGTSPGGRRKSLPGMPKALQRLFADSGPGSGKGPSRSLRERLIRRPRAGGSDADGADVVELGKKLAWLNSPLPEQTPTTGNTDRKEPDMRTKGKASAPERGHQPPTSAPAGGGRIAQLAAELAAAMRSADTSTLPGREALIADLKALSAELPGGFRIAGNKVGEGWNAEGTEAALVHIANLMGGIDGLITEADAPWQRKNQSKIDYAKGESYEGPDGRRGFNYEG